ncbi:esterase [Ichthyenterobacterium sp. W332]|uniref:Esterase n=1 Tax=Microcosmobacter mediterraneus TaxID=3075607 RepID=A0ABU2YGH6_9FLAO|nr:esterase [Ichthyenterobacterium sp. W332]MDT0557268.1 esterase [Ichthyenterobacterium sp. W332]
MNSTEKDITYTSNNTYSTLNTLSDKTKNVWFVCHGMGYLSKYFLKYFKELNAENNYIIAPQAPSKYYIQPKFHVGANWLTKDNTAQGTENIMRYFDAIFEAEQIPKHLNLIVFGYSQGVSVAMRYVAFRQLQCSQLVLHSGGIPKEFKTEDFHFLKAKITMIYGTKDEYLDNERMAYETNRIHELFGDKATIIPFDGKHVVNVDLITNLI